MPEGAVRVPSDIVKLLAIVSLVSWNAHAPPVPLNVNDAKDLPADVMVLPVVVDTKLIIEVESAGVYVIPATNFSDPAEALPIDRVIPVLCVRVPV